MKKEFIDRIIELSRIDSSFRFYRRYLREADFGDAVRQELFDHPWFSSERLLMICFSRGIVCPVACECGGFIDVRKALKGNRFCSVRCSNGNAGKKLKEIETNMLKYGYGHASQSNEVRERMKMTMLERYGVEYPLQCKEVKEKMKNTCMDRYGVGNASQSKEVKEKMKNTCMDRYGVGNASQSNEVKEKMKNTMLERYGVEHALQSGEILSGMKKRNLEKYGVENTIQCKEVKEKARNTVLERYGVENASQCKEIKDKVKNTCIERYGAGNYMHSDEYRRRSFLLLSKFSSYVIPLFGWESWQGWNNGISYSWRCVECGSEFSTGVHCFKLDGIKMPRCMRCHPFLGNGSSENENELYDFVCSVEGKSVVHGDRNIIYPLELDVYVPEKHVAIEFDGLYWHSGKDEHYHLGKTEECMKKGIRLIHVFEDEWDEKQEIVKDRIRSILGVNERIYARKCIVKDISSRECSEFLEDNHLQGADYSSVRYGLYREDELVAVMTFGRPRFNRKYDWELIRYCSKLGYNVIGGASKLLRYFMKNNSGSIISYADRRYSDGNLYEKLGFKLAGCSSPSYWYIKGNEKLSRYQCQKHRLAKMLEKYDGNLSEYENMLNNGYDRIYDCGNYVYAIERD